MPPPKPAPPAWLPLDARLASRPAFCPMSCADRTILTDCGGKPRKASDLPSPKTCRIARKIGLLSDPMMTYAAPGVQGAIGRILNAWARVGEFYSSDARSSRFAAAPEPFSSRGRRCPREGGRKRGRQKRHPPHPALRATFSRKGRRCQPALDLGVMRGHSCHRRRVQGEKFRALACPAAPWRRPRSIWVDASIRRQTPKPRRETPPYGLRGRLAACPSRRHFQPIARASGSGL